jgi:hypothetical protein
MKAGRAGFGAQIRIADDEERPLPHDGEAVGHLRARSPWISSGYFKGTGGDALDGQGWLRTGDVASIDPDGYIAIVDRSKDLIKSGGEWISSIALEIAACGHPKVMQAPAIAAFPSEWQERPAAADRHAQGAAGRLELATPRLPNLSQSYLNKKTEDTSSPLGRMMRARSRSPATGSSPGAVSLLAPAGTSLTSLAGRPRATRLSHPFMRSLEMGAWLACSSTYRATTPFSITSSIDTESSPRPMVPPRFGLSSP